MRTSDDGPNMRPDASPTPNSAVLGPSGRRLAGGRHSDEEQRCKGRHPTRLGHDFLVPIASTSAARPTETSTDQRSGSHPKRPGRASRAAPFLRRFSCRRPTKSQTRMSALVVGPGSAASTVPWRSASAVRAVSTASWSVRPSAARTRYRRFHDLAGGLGHRPFQNLA